MLLLLGLLVQEQIDACNQEAWGRNIYRFDKISQKNISHIMSVNLLEVVKIKDEKNKVEIEQNPEKHVQTLNL